MKHFSSLIAVLVMVLGVVYPAWATTPVVNAGPDQTQALPAKDFTLFGAAADPDGDPLAVTWTQVSGPSATIKSPRAPHTTVTVTTNGTYVFQLAAFDGVTTTTDQMTLTVNTAASQTAFYVDPTYTGSVQNGSASQPWKSFLDSNGNFNAKWTAIRNALATNDVIIYFSARKAGSDVSEVISPPTGATMFINRGCHASDPNCTDPDTTGTHRLTLDGMSKYNTNDAAPNWVDYTGTKRFKINCVNTCGSMSLGWGDDMKRDYITIRGFEVTGPGARIVWGGSYTTLEHIWAHDVSNVGATVIFSGAVDGFPTCSPLGVSTDITVRNLKVERGIGEGIYIAGNYLFESDGGCPALGNNHTNILIEGNTITDAGINGEQGDGVDLKAGLVNVTVRDNVISFGHAEDGADGITCSGTFGSTEANYLFEGNRVFSNAGAGIQLGNLRRTTVRNNVVYNNGRGWGVNIYGDEIFSNTDIEISNNTVSGNPYGIALGNTTNAAVRNNILLNNTAGGEFQVFFWGTGITSDYNFFVPDGGQDEGTHSLVQPSASGVVVNLAGGDFHLTATSPAKDVGLDLSTLGNLLVGGDGSSFVVDFDKVTRPQGSAWDMGAYERP